MTTTSTSTVILRNDAAMDESGAVNEIAVVGDGYFVVRDPETSETYAAQSDNFSLDDEGYLVDEAGARLQGRISGDSGVLGDLQVNAAGAPAGTPSGAVMLCYSIDIRGRIHMHLTDGSSFVRGQIMLQNFKRPEALIRISTNLFSNLSCAGPLPAMIAPRASGLGAIQWGVLELSHAGSSAWMN